MANHRLFCRAFHCASNGEIKFHAKNSLWLILYPKFCSSLAYKKCYAGSMILLCGILNRTSSTSSCTKSKSVISVQRGMLIFTIEALLLTVISQESYVKLPVQCKSVLQCVTLLRLSTLHKEDQNCVQIQQNTTCSYPVAHTVTFSASAPASVPAFPSCIVLHMLQGWFTKIWREFILKCHRHSNRPAHLSCSIGSHKT